GPIGFDALATLLRAREFRRKSHSKLAGPTRLRSFASSRVAASPLSTTLPALADVTRSRESVRGAPSSRSNGEPPSSRLSPGPSELAGWTGQVPAHAEPKPGSATRGKFQLGPLSGARLVGIAVLAGAIGSAIFGFSLGQTQPPPVAAKLPISRDLRVPARVPSVPVTVSASEPALNVRASEPALNVGASQPAVRLAPSVALPASAPRTNARVAAKAAATANPAGGAPPSSNPRTSELTASTAGLNVAPTLIRPLDHFAP
ncbi:MAG TPA: hypothetical protein VGJ91_12780, partial [Polyangiaceae bacterium]